MTPPGGGRPIQPQNVQYGIRHDFGTPRHFVRCQQCWCDLLVAANPTQADISAAVTDHVCPVEPTPTPSV